MTKTNIGKKTLTLICREYWEHRIIMLWLPVGFTLITLLLQTFATINATTNDNGAADSRPPAFSYTYHESSVEDVAADGTTSTVTKKSLNTKNFTASELLLTLLGRNKSVESNSPLDGMLIGFSFAMLALLIMSLLTYTHSCLYGDRVRKEMLFWHSLPVSETHNLLGKLLVIFIVIPTIYCLMILVYGIGALLLGGLGAENWLLLVLKVSHITISTILSMLVFIPLISWMLFCSAAAKKSPVFLSLLLPVAVGMLLKFALGKNYLSAAISGYLKALGTLNFGPEMMQQLVSFFQSTEFLTALALSAGLLVAAVWLRNHRYEI